MSVLYLSSSELDVVLPMSEAIEAMRRAFTALSTGEAEVPIQSHIPLSEPGAGALFMPAYAHELNGYGVKIAGVHPSNPAAGLDFVQAVMLWFNAETGRLDAIVEGNRLTAIRTGAGSGLATDLLALPQPASVLVIGTGVQARTQLEAVAAVRDIDVVWCLSRSRERMERFAEEMSERLQVEIRLVTERGVISTCQIVCTATTSEEPVLSAGEVAPGTHINAVGAHRPEHSEIDPELVASSCVVVDHFESCIVEAGDLIRPMNNGLVEKKDLATEIGQVAAGRAIGRRDESDITLFKSVGNAVQDIYAAAEAVKNARSMGVGESLDI